MFKIQKFMTEYLKHISWSISFDILWCVVFDENLKNESKSWLILKNLKKILPNNMKIIRILNIILYKIVIFNLKNWTELRFSHTRYLISQIWFQKEKKILQLIILRKIWNLITNSFLTTFHFNWNSEKIIKNLRVGTFIDLKNIHLLYR
jgi:hypothetical protein